MNHESFGMARIRLWSHFSSFFYVRNTYGDYVTTVSFNETHAAVFYFLWLSHMYRLCTLYWVRIAHFLCHNLQIGFNWAEPYTPDIL